MPDVAPECDHSMFSLYDASDEIVTNDGQRDIFIPSLVMDRYEYVNGGYNIPIANESCLPISLPKGMIIGEVVLHQTDLRTTGAECYDLVELLDEMQERSGKTWKEEREEEEKDEKEWLASRNKGKKGRTGRSKKHFHVSTANLSSTTTSESSPSSGSAADATARQPVLFSQLVGVNKVEAETMDRCR